MTIRRRFLYWSLFWWSLLMLICFGTPTPAATLTAGVTDFVWGDVFSAATNADTCVIPYGVTIVVRGADAGGCGGGLCKCGRMDVDGTLIVADDATLQVGASGGGLVNAMDIGGNNGGSVIVNGTVLTDCGANSQTTCEWNGADHGSLLVGGSHIIDGKITAVVGEACPEGYFDPARDADNDGPDECDTAAEYDITVKVDFPVTVGQFDGMRLYFYPPYSGHPGRFYDIRSSTAPNTLVLNGASRGQLLPHGVVLTNTAAGMNTTTVTLGTSLSADDQEGVLGAWLVCDSECTSASDVDETASPTGQPVFKAYLPCSKARRITSVTDATHVVINSAVAASACTASAAARIIAEPGQNWPRVEPTLAVHAGDSFSIDKPAVVSIPQANKGLRLTYAATGNAAQDKNWVMDVGDNFLVRFDRADVAYCGRKDEDTTADQCFTINRTAANTSGRGVYRNTEFYMTSGGNYIASLRNEPTVDISWVTVRDSEYSDDNAAGDQHSFLILENDGAYRGADINITGLQAIRTDDDLVYDGPDLIGDQDWGDITIRKTGCYWMPNNTTQATSECIQFLSSALGISGRLTISESVVVDVESGIGLSLNAGQVVVRDSVVANTQQGFGYGADYLHGATFTSKPTAYVNVACLSCGETGSVMSDGGRVYSSYFGSVGGAGSGTPTTLASFYGSVIDFTNQAAGPYWYDPLSTSSTKFESGGPVLRDNLLMNGAQGIAGTNQRTGITTTIDHLTWINKASDNSVGYYVTNSLLPSGGTVSVTNSLMFGIGAIVSTNNGPPSTWNVRANAGLGLWEALCGGADCAGCCGATNTTLGALGVLSARNPLVLAESVARTLTTTDGSAYAGARCSGPADWGKLERLAPFVTAVRRAGVIDPDLCTDTDGDGIWDIHDRCVTDPNPLCS